MRACACAVLCSFCARLAKYILPYASGGKLLRQNVKFNICLSNYFAGAFLHEFQYPISIECHVAVFAICGFKTY